MNRRKNTTIRRLKRLVFVIMTIAVAMTAAYLGVRSGFLRSVTEKVFGGVFATTSLLAQETVCGDKCCTKARQLEQRNAELTARLAHVEEKASYLEFIVESATSTPLLRAMNAGDETAITLIAAKVRGRVPGAFDGEIFVDKGSDDGVRTGFSAVTGEGAVGRVIKSGRDHSVVKLVTSRDSAISVAIMSKDDKNAAVFGMANGDGFDRLNARSFPAHSNIKNGMRVVTSGYGDFPGGIDVGTVEKVKYFNHSPAPVIVIRPAVSTGNVRHVILMSRAHNNIKSPVPD